MTTASWKAEAYTATRVPAAGRPDGAGGLDEFTEPRVQVARLIDALVGDGLAYLDCPVELVRDGTVRFLPPRSVVLQVRPEAMDDDDVDACRDLVARGYRIGLVDIDPATVPPRLLAVAASLKVPARGVARGAAVLARRGRPADQELIAVGVESHDRCQAAVAAGATHVRGDFYVRPDVVDARKITGVTRSYVDVLREASAAEVDYERLAASRSSGTCRSPTSCCGT